MKRILLLILTLSFSTVLFAQRLHTDGSKLTNGNTVVNINKNGMLGTVLHNGKKLIVYGSIEIKKGTNTEKVTLGDAKLSQKNGAVYAVNEFVHKKAKMKLTSVFTPIADGFTVDYQLEANKGYQLTAASLLFDVDVYDGDIYKINGKVKKLLSREGASASETTWNIFQQNTSCMSFDIGLDESVETKVYFRQMAGSVGIVLPTASDAYNDYVVNFRPNTPGKVSLYVALPKGGEPVAFKEPKKANKVAKQTTTTPLRVKNKQTISNDKSTVLLKNSGLMGAVTHNNTTLLSNALLIVKKDGKVINLKMGSNYSTKVNGNTLEITNNINFQGDEYTLVTTATAGKGSVDFLYTLDGPANCKLVGVTLNIKYDTFLGESFLIGNTKGKYIDKSTAPEEWHYIVFGKKASSFKATTKKGLDFGIDLTSSTGKMDMIIQRPGNYFKDYMLKLWVDQPGKVGFKLTLPETSEM
ncbi:hypothetical protein EI427_22415 [Flammeovirga pectinis]|uniref:Uncharacterized protein n=1 Tax=Flammeovirga pectinis TaxID=2494373 RepID=A0A3Q9FUP0_9BACT|nr:hypothetical protein [Flammeovirga pectinis]AZQ64978.1 hypothetical protein EI427_22415 [Flammeovirga pectinis]